ncbi:MarR family winged helix-turn-helix transcriptional regulator [Parafrigoribacterium mesophilum]|uniref:MarR family winged helix-turn-helix transcriptional regulator n=1 Tax=Parafrigoribacterium mesophilum TaxID=433646 RepID=UPI0031FD27D0
MATNAEELESLAPGGTTSLERDHELLVVVAARLRRLNMIVLGHLEVSLTFGQYRTLGRIVGGCASLGELSAQAGVTLPTVSETVNGLVRRGLIETRQSEADRRSVVLYATEAGTAAVAAGDSALREVIGALTGKLTYAQRTALADSLQVIYDAATEYLTDRLTPRS